MFKSMQSISHESDFSAPWMRTSLLNTPTYIASNNFNYEVVWTKTGNMNELKTASHDNNDAPSVRATCAVVGIVSDDRLFLDAHGNFNPIFDKSGLEACKAQFQLISPNHHADFKSDFKLGIENIENLQMKAVTEGATPQYFIVFDGTNKEKAFRFSWPLFEKRTIAYDSTDDEDWSNGYPIAEKFQGTFESIISKWRANPLPAFDVRGNFIKLRHYTIRDKQTIGVAGNTFSATATQVQVLEPATKRAPSPYKSLLLKGPTFLPQSPSKINNQKRAVDAFHPGAVAGASNVDLTTSVNTDLNSTSRHVLALEDVASHELSKADGKKRAVDEDEDATATEGETSIIEGPLKKKKKQNK
ncbi:hypothetical protein BYT27DRAFT_7340892 [Phlegmacium glaucopus]|nr:hypothetical protein BYT27DRAFT_7340892 [Phlegmacium glaucopus]